jgi:hypothetical protein
MDQGTTEAGAPISRSPRLPSPVAASLRALAYRCQYEGGTDRELDNDIFHAIHGIRFKHDDHGWRYSESIDAALMLVPPHHLWELKRGFECRAIVWCLERDYDDDGAPTGYNATLPARALCAAALYARAELEDRK